MLDKDIKPAYKHTGFGNLMFFLSAKITKLLVRVRPLYYILACIWGILLTIAGLFVTLGLAIAKTFNKNIKFEKYYWIYDIKAGPKYWGGFEMGLMFVRDQKSVQSLNKHEFGHTFQNCLFGPFMPLLTLSSAIRYWYRELKYERKNLACPTDYDSYWLEDAATQCGTYAVKYLKNLDKLK